MLDTIVRPEASALHGGYIYWRLHDGRVFRTYNGFRWELTDWPLRERPADPSPARLPGDAHG